MDRRTTALLLGLILSVLGTGVGIMVVGHQSGSSACTGERRRSYSVVIRDSVQSATVIHANRCDKISFTNQDKVAREIGFGNHDDHVPYDGIAERVLNKGDSFVITLNQTGTFHWHDHLHDELNGTFSVEN